MDAFQYILGVCSGFLVAKFHYNLIALGQPFLFGRCLLERECLNVSRHTSEEYQEPETLKTLRQNLEITQEELSRRLNLSFRTVGDWETGKKTPRFDNAATLSRELGVSLKALAKAMRVDVTRVPGDYSSIELKAITAELGIEQIEDLPEDYKTLRRMRDRQNWRAPQIQLHINVAPAERAFMCSTAIR